MNRIAVAKELIAVAKEISAGENEFPKWRVVSASDDHVYLSTVISIGNKAWSGTDHNLMQKYLDASASQIKPKVEMVMKEYGMVVKHGAKPILSKSLGNDYAYIGRLEFNAELRFSPEELKRDIEKVL